MDHYHPTQWRGCLDPFQDSAIKDDWSVFGTQVIDPAITNLTVYQFSSCFADLCNKPLKCYTCTSGLNTSCLPDDVGPLDCLASQPYCAVYYSKLLI